MDKVEMARQAHILNFAANGKPIMRCLKEPDSSEELTDAEIDRIGIWEDDPNPEFNWKKFDYKVGRSRLELWVNQIEYGGNLVDYMWFASEEAAKEGSLQECSRVAIKMVEDKEGRENEQ